jgi:hypothetical protein
MHEPIFHHFPNPTRIAFLSHKTEGIPVITHSNFCRNLGERKGKLSVMHMAEIKTESQAQHRNEGCLFSYRAQNKNISKRNKTRSTVLKRV